MMSKTDKYKHLEPWTLELLTLPKDERIRICLTDRWIGHTQALNILQQLDLMLAYPFNPIQQSVTIVAADGNGKTSIIKRFCELHPVEICSATGDPIAPVICFKGCKSAPLDESKLWSCMLWDLCISHDENSPVQDKRLQLEQAITYVNIKIVIFEDVQDWDYSLIVSVYKLCLDLKLSPILTTNYATEDLLKPIVFDSWPYHFPQQRIINIDNWQLNIEYFRFLASYESLLPLSKPSNLAGKEIAPLIFNLSGENLGKTVKIIKAAAAEAIKLDIERITPELLNHICPLAI